MDLEIRQITLEDIPHVVNIQIKGWQTAYRGIIDDEYLDSLNAEEKKVKRKRDFNKSPFVVAVLDGEIVGFCRYLYEVVSNDGEGYDSEVMALYVKPNLKGKGIGRRIFEYVRNDLLNHGKKKMILWCLKDNMPSRAFYEKMGGKIVAEHGIEIGSKIYPEVGFGYTL